MTSTPDFAVLKFSGSDTVTFLQGQLTSDVSALNDTWQLSGYCSPKGRLLAIFYLFKFEDGVLAVVDRSIVESVIKRLRMYVLRSDVTVELLESATLGVDLNQAMEYGTLTAANNYVQLGFGEFCVDLSLDGSTASAHENGLDWAHALITAGIPTISAATQEMFVPQMVNLDLLGGISFKKGCYTGQEIVARMHYLGKLKQRMFLCEVSDQVATQVGHKIVTDEAKNAGNLVSPVINGRCLAVLRTEYTKNGLAFEAGGSLSVAESQPYSLEVKKS